MRSWRSCRLLWGCKVVLRVLGWAESGLGDPGGFVRWFGEVLNPHPDPLAPQRYPEISRDIQRYRWTLQDAGRGRGLCVGVRLPGAGAQLLPAGEGEGKSSRRSLFEGSTFPRLQVVAVATLPCTGWGPLTAARGATAKLDVHPPQGWDPRIPVSSPFLSSQGSCAPAATSAPHSLLWPRPERPSPAVSQ